MNYSEYQYTVLCEDTAHFHFVRGWLEAKGANGRKIRSYGALPHEGCGKAYVLDNFKQSIGQYRSTASKTNTILIVAIDADNLTVDAVINHFKDSDEDKVFFVIPKWSIDSWFHFIQEHPTITNDFENEKDKTLYRKNARHGKLGKQLAQTIESEMQLPPSLEFTYNTIKAKKKTLGLS